MTAPSSNRRRLFSGLLGRLLLPSLLLPSLALAAASCVASDDDEGLQEDDGGALSGAEVAASADKILLPVEVLGRSGTKKAVRFDVADASGITHLYLRCNACGYDDVALNRGTKVKATVIVNGSAIPLKHFTENGKVYGNTALQVIGGEKDYGGIGGTFRTVRILIPVRNIRTGSNTIEFEHTSAVAPSIASALSR